MACHLAIDSSVALGFSRREGLGKAKHVELHWLLLQQYHRDGRIRLCKIPGTENAADLFTKPLAGRLFEGYLAEIGMLVPQGA